jgi:methylenetetrahydrofolate dehydrogenase (NADP+)/methenyltetrahydrofolate cyclohydrolase/formyltetrahydrofolate synthetase
MLNDDNDVHGIIVQMPLDSDHKIDARRVLDAVDPDKDVDGSVFYLPRFGM